MRRFYDDLSNLTSWDLLELLSDVRAVCKKFHGFDDLTVNSEVRKMAVNLAILKYNAYPIDSA